MVRESFLLNTCAHNTFLPTKILSATLMTLYFPSLKKMIMSSMSEQLHTNSSFFSPVPMNPSCLLISLASTTFVTSMVSNERTSVRRG